MMLLLAMIESIGFLTAAGMALLLFWSDHETVSIATAFAAMVAGLIIALLAEIAIRLGEVTNALLAAQKERARFAKEDGR